MKMKKLLAVAVSAMTVAAILAGCGSTQQQAESLIAEAESQVTSAISDLQSELEQATSDTEPESESAESQAEPEASEEPIKVALIFNSSMSDGGWNWDAYQGMEQLAKEYNLAPSYQENVGDDTIQDVLRNYAAEGYPLIIDNEQYHGELLVEVAAEYPDVTFACINGYLGADNVIALKGDMWQHVYVAGVAAAGVSESKKIGLITYSTDSPSATIMREALTAGAKSYDPNCEIIHVATGSFSDLQKGIELSNSLMDQGCDVIYCNSGDCNPSVYDNVISKQKYAIGQSVDWNYLSDEYMLGCCMMPSSNMVRRVVEGWLNGTLTGSEEVMVGGLAEGFEEWRWNEPVKAKIDPAIVAACDAATEAIESGEITMDL